MCTTQQVTVKSNILFHSQINQFITYFLHWKLQGPVFQILEPNTIGPQEFLNEQIKCYPLNEFVMVGQMKCYNVIYNL